MTYFKTDLELQRGKNTDKENKILCSCENTRDVNTKNNSCKKAKSHRSKLRLFSRLKLRKYKQEEKLLNLTQLSTGTNVSEGCLKVRDTRERLLLTFKDVQNHKSLIGSGSK